MFYFHRLIDFYIVYVAFKHRWIDCTITKCWNKLNVEGISWLFCYVVYCYLVNNIKLLQSTWTTLWCKDVWHRRRYVGCRLYPCWTSTQDTFSSWRVRLRSVDKDISGIRNSNGRNLACESIVISEFIIW